MNVTEDLDLDVARRLHEPLEEDRAVAERSLGFARGRRDRVGEVRGIVHQPHPRPPPPIDAFTITGNPVAGKRAERRRVAG